ncbi:unnamed protein product [Medioppia subpectinata]|uniref:E2 ubiquitin-conjugating enzyme n=1 Tax=Medioppia subpectinata TaxID=1979941 RepID=A0A7R9Q568_9ACAR|nr:unnamed protein product [Medioppia subpectinata]CAG2112031.1 unnamed protein product [Medioppia subpectinata]
MALNRIRAELAEFRRDPPPGCRASPVGTDYFQWTGSIDGPPDTPYEGGVFNITITFPQNYPFKAPKIVFTTRIYHPNIRHDGTIYLDTLHRNWSAGLTIGAVLLSVQQLMTDPNPNEPADGTIARQYTANREGFNQTARQWTVDHASPPPGHVFTVQTTSTNSQDSAGAGHSD